MDGLFDVVILDVRKHPDIAGCFPRGLPESWPTFGPLKYFFPGYFEGTLIGSKLKV